MFFMHMFDSPVFYLLLSTWTRDTFLTLRGTQGFFLNHVLPPRPSKSYSVDVTVSYVVSQPATPIFSLSLSNLTWDTFLTLLIIQGLYLNHVLPPRPSKSYRVDGTVGWSIFCSTAHINPDTWHGCHSYMWSGLAPRRGLPEPTEPRDSVSHLSILKSMGKKLGTSTQTL